MDCGGRSPQAISLKFLLDRWNCLETIMRCFGLFFFFPAPPPSTLGLIQYLFFTAISLKNVSCAFKKMFSSVFLSYTSHWKQSKKSKTKSGNSWTGFPRSKKKKKKFWGKIFLLPSFLKINSLVNLIVKEHKHEMTVVESLDFWFGWHCI